MTSDESDLRLYMQLDQESIRAWLHLIGHVIFFFFFSGRYLFIDTMHTCSDYGSSITFLLAKFIFLMYAYVCLHTPLAI